ncbi:MAG: ATP-binding protein [Pseudomonadota bacterium]
MAAVLVAVAIAAIGLTMLFRAHVEGWIDRTLDAHMSQLISGIDRGAGGKLSVSQEPADPRFAQPLSGMYWEVVVVGTGQVFRSRSLWDYEIKLPPVTRSSGRLVHHKLAGPQGEALYALQRRVILPERLGGRPAQFAVAINDTEVQRAVWEFATILVPCLLLIGGLLACAALFQVHVGLSPLERVEDRLMAIQRGAADKLGDAWPEEIRPLVREIDGLLTAQEQRITKARSRAADLAHGLKTPLQVLRSESRSLAAKGERESAATVEQMTQTMSRHVERQMVRARLGNTGAYVEAHLASAVAKVMEIVKRSPAGASLAWDVKISQALKARIDPDDLIEALGNVLENAARYGRGSIKIVARRRGDVIALTISDDGPGIEPAAIGCATQRGVRLDSSSSGAGLGLAIVDDIVEAWGGSLELKNAKPGLIVELALPVAIKHRPQLRVVMASGF